MGTAELHLRGCRAGSSLWEMEPEDLSLKDLYKADEKTPDIIPSDVTEFFLRRSGFACDDPVVVRVVSLAAQKFLTDLAKESYAFSKKRQRADAAEEPPLGAAARRRGQRRFQVWRGRQQARLLCRLAQCWRCSDDGREAHGHHDHHWT